MLFSMLTNLDSYWETLDTYLVANWIFLKNVTAWTAAKTQAKYFYFAVK